jgi:hypothetical protein
MIVTRVQIIDDKINTNNFLMNMLLQLGKEQSHTKQVQSFHDII